MKNQAFSELLTEFIGHSGLSKASLARLVTRTYGPRIKLTEKDIQRYLNGELIPKTQKLAAIADELGLTAGEIARLVRSTVTRNSMT